jgi:hypothetical protein
LEENRLISMNPLTYEMGRLVLVDIIIGVENRMITLKNLGLQGIEEFQFSEHLFMLRTGLVGSVCPVSVFVPGFP